MKPTQFFSLMTTIWAASAMSALNNAGAALVVSGVCCVLTIVCMWGEKQ